MSLVRPFRVISVPVVFALFLAALLAASPVAAAVCGNAIVETGEDCDDGSSNNGSTNSCCTVACRFSGKSPDVIVGDLVGTTNYGTVGTITAYAVGTTSCNLGSCWLNWVSGTAEHPVIGQNMYRLKDGRYEQIGQSWLKHGFTALQGSVCSGSCVAAPDGTHLGVNCSDPYSSGLNGSQSRLGPKVDVNPDTGVYLYPDSRISTTGDAIFKRLQVHNGDLDPASNPGALYFVEGQYVTHDDAAAKNNPNNASYRPATIGAAPTYNLTLTGSTVRQKAGIQAWKATDPSVTETLVPAPEGIFIIAAKATSLGGGIYHYEYAVQNLNNNRAAQSFSVPIPAGTVVTNVGFHDVDYHSGEPFDGTDWTPTVAANSVSWNTLGYGVNQNANALRWGTLYNFRFDANVAPGFASAGIELFKPGNPTSVSATTVAPNPCLGAPDGTLCSDGNGCTRTDTCQSGVCQGVNPVVCAASDQCHTVGTCSPDTGICSNPNVANGTACTDGNLCTLTDTCQSGVCTGANPVVCTASDQCHAAGTCSPGTGACSNPAKANGTACNDGNGCTQTDTCQSAVCTGANPVVCTASDQCHTAGTCNPGTGACSNPAKANGTACSDGNACTQTDACQSGTCTGANPVVCTASDQCHAAGTCNSATGVCSNPAKANGTGCDDGNACTQTDACQSGTCAGTNPVACTASDQCHAAGTCDPATGVCSNPALADGAACSDGNGCTADDTCQSGACASGMPVVCAPIDSCHEAGTCDPATGVCSGPALADGSACTDGDACTAPDACLSGTCLGGSPVVCSAIDVCHDSGTCDPATGICSNPPRIDGVACDDGNACTTDDVCAAGICAGTGVPSPLEVDDGVRISQSDGIATITWNPALGSTWSAVLRGFVSQLPVGPGGGDEVCLDTGLVGSSTTDAAKPDPGEAYWYLIQGISPCGKGSYGFQVQGGVSAPRVSSTCP